MLDKETVEEQQRLLDTWRGTLAHLLRQAAEFGGESFAPPQTANGIREARHQIQQIKQVLRSNGMEVNEQPGEELPSATAEYIAEGRSTGQPLERVPLIRTIMSAVLPPLIGFVTNLATGGTLNAAWYWFVIAGILVIGNVGVELWKTRSIGDKSNRGDVKTISSNSNTINSSRVKRRKLLLIASGTLLLLALTVYIGVRNWLITVPVFQETVLSRGEVWKTSTYDLTVIKLTRISGDQFEVKWRYTNTGADDVILPALYFNGYSAQDQHRLKIKTLAVLCDNVACNAQNHVIPKGSSYEYTQRISFDTVGYMAINWLFVFPPNDFSQLDLPVWKLYEE